MIAKLSDLVKKLSCWTTKKAPLLALRDDFRQMDWAEVYKYPTVILQQMRELVGTARGE